MESIQRKIILIIAAIFFIIAAISATLWAASAQEKDQVITQKDEPVIAKDKPDSRTNRIDFGNTYIIGQTIKSGAVYLLQRKKSEIKSMLKYREDYREEILDGFLVDTARVTAKDQKESQSSTGKRQGKDHLVSQDGY
jgi:hypothetical protein